MFGQCPDWYRLIKAARYLQVAPWDLARQSHLWTEWALTAQSAEVQASEQHQHRATQIRQAKAGS